MVLCRTYMAMGSRCGFSEVSWTGENGVGGGGGGR